MTPHPPAEAGARALPPLTTAGLGRHVASEPGSLSIRSFVGGRFPRHRADVGDDLDREYAELTVSDHDVVEGG
jgi:hypothetical protein